MAVSSPGSGRGPSFGRAEISGARLHSTPAVRLRYFSLALGLLSFVWLYHSEGNYERDEAALFFASQHLEAAERGELPLYRYPLQPLTYELLSGLYRGTGSARVVALVPGFFGAAGILFLIAAMGRRSGNVGLLARLALIGLVPELWFSLLYISGSALALGLLGAAIFILLPATAEPPPRAREVSLCALAGAIAALGCLFRMDFLTALPMLGFLAVRSDPLM